MMNSRSFFGHRALEVQMELNRAFAEMFRRMFDTMRVWQQRSQQRRQLGFLSERDLRDIGVSEARRDAEMRKPFWKA